MSAADPEFGNVDLPSEPTRKGPLKPVAEYTKLEIIAGLIGGTTATLALVNMIIAGSNPFVILAGAFALVSGPYFYMQRNELVDIATFKEVQEEIERQMEALKQHNAELSTNIDEIAATNEDLLKIKDTFNNINSMTEGSVEDLKKNVEFLRRNVSDQYDSVEADVVKIIFDLIDYSDEDQDFIFDENEVDKVVQQLKAIPNITVHEDRIRAKLTNRDMGACREILLELKDGNVSESERLFDLELSRRLVIEN